MGSQEREGVSGDTGREGVCEEVGVGADSVLTMVALVYKVNISALKLQVSVCDDVTTV